MPQQPWQNAQSQISNAFQGCAQHDSNDHDAHMTSDASRPERLHPSSAPHALSPRAGPQLGPPQPRRPSSASAKSASPPQIFTADCTVVILTSEAGRDLDIVVAAWSPAGSFAQAGAVSASAHLGMAYINFANAAQAAAAVDIFNSRQLSDISKSPFRQRATLKSCRDAYQQVSQQPYFAQKLKAVDKAHFSAAGLLLLHTPQKGKPVSAARA